MANREEELRKQMAVFAQDQDQQVAIRQLRVYIMISSLGAAVPKHLVYIRQILLCD